MTATWLDDWANRIELTIDSTKIDENITDYPLLITLASGTGRNSADVTDVFDELTVTNSGTIDSYTSLLLHPDGDASASQHTITVNGDASTAGTVTRITTTAPIGFSHSYYFDGTGAYYLDVPTDADFSFGSDDFTIDFWMNTSAAVHQYMVTGESDHCFLIAIHDSSTTKLGLYLGNDSSWSETGGTVGTATVTDGVWYHIALVRTGDNFRVYVNGTLDINFDSSESYTLPGSTIGIAHLTGIGSGRFNGYLSEVRVSKGIARWTPNFTPPTAPYTTTSGIDSNTKLLLHMEGDSSATDHTTTLNGNPQITTTAPTGFEHSLYFDGTGDYLSMADHDDWTFDTNNFTIDFWIKRGRISTQELVWGQGDASATGPSISVRMMMEADDEINFYLASTSIATGYYLNTTSAYYHIAVVRNGTDFLTFVNGALVDTTDIGSSATVNATSPWNIGRQGDYNGLYFQGYISEYRISKGIARWTSNFTTPTEPYSTTTVSGIDSYTKYLLHPDGDQSSTGHTVTFNGDMDMDSSNSKFDGSYYFDGTGDYMELSSHSDFNLSTSVDFTVEAWVKPDSAGTVGYIISKWDSTLPGGWALYWEGTSDIVRFFYNAPSDSADSEAVFTDTDWTHVAVVGIGTTVYFYRNGAIAGYGTISLSAANFSLCIGNRSGGTTAATYFDGYIDEVRISNGIARWPSTNDVFTPPSSPYTTVSGIDSYTKLLIHPEGDLSANAHDVIFHGAMDIDLSVGKFNGSYYFSGSASNFLSVPDDPSFDFGSGDFTIDWWEYRESGAGVSITRAISGDEAFLVGYGSSPLQVYMSSGSGWDIANAELMSTDSHFDVWVHYAVVRSGNNFYVFKNGAMQSTWISDKALYVSNQALYIGRRVSSQFFKGYMSEIRLSKGTARWTINFDPPGNPYPNYTDIISYASKKIALTTYSGSGTEQQLYVEIEDWNPYEERAWLWAKVPTVFSGIDTTLYLYYDSSQPDNTTYVGNTGDAPAQNVWDAYYKGVWHMSDVDLSSQLKDSTGNMYNGTPTNVDLQDSISAVVAKGSNFDLSEYFTIPTDAITTGASTRTLEFLMNYDSADGTYEYPVSFGTASTREAFGVYMESTDDIQFYTQVTNQSYSYVGYFGEWQYIQFSYDGTNAKGYINLSNVTNDNPVLNTGTTGFKIGAKLDNTLSFDGQLDEIRLSDIVRSVAYRKANYYNHWDDLVSFGIPAPRPTFVFTGYVDVYGAPEARTVYLYRRSTGEFVGSTTSDAITGYFEVAGVYNEYHFVVILPEVGDGFNLLSYDQISPGT